MPAPRRANSYDVAVVGAGLAGLTSGAVLARAGRRVVVLEQGAHIGGYAQSFRRGLYVFDPAVHLSMDMDSVVDLLDRLGLRDQCRPVPLDAFYAAAFPGMLHVVPPGLDAYIEAHARLAPGEGDGIRRFIGLCLEVARAGGEKVKMAELDTVKSRFPGLVRYHRASAAHVLREYVRDPRIAALMTAFWPYIGLPPGRLSFAEFARTLINLSRKPWYCMGGFERLARALASAVGAGGDVRTASRVVKIIVNSGDVLGVELESGERIEVRYVISNADATQTFLQLVGVEHLPAGFLRRLERLRPSLSAFLLFGGGPFVLPPDAAHETFIHSGWDHEAAYRAVESGSPDGFWLSIPSRGDPELAPPGHHVAIVASLAPYEHPLTWDTARPLYHERMLLELNRFVQGATDHLSHVETATPHTLRRFTLNRDGAIYGWRPGNPRLDQASPLRGLSLAGHWTRPGHSSGRVLISGLHAALALLARTGDRQAVARFQPIAWPRP